MPGGPREQSTGLPGSAYVAQPDRQLALAADVQAACLRHALAADAEACGLLLWEDTTATAYVPAENVAVLATRTFELYLPQPVWDTLLDTEEQAGVQLGLWHSHVHGGPHPSVADMLHLDPAWHGRPYVLYSVRDGAWWLGRVLPQ